MKVVERLVAEAYSQEGNAFKSLQILDLHHFYFLSTEKYSKRREQILSPKSSVYDDMSNASPDIYKYEECGDNRIEVILMGTKHNTTWG